MGRDETRGRRPSRSNALGRAIRSSVEPWEVRPLLAGARVFEKWEGEKSLRSTYYSIRSYQLQVTYEVVAKRRRFPGTACVSPAPAARRARRSNWLPAAAVLPLPERRSQSLEPRSGYLTHSGGQRSVFTSQLCQSPRPASCPNWPGVQSPGPVPLTEPAHSDSAHSPAELGTE